MKYIDGVLHDWSAFYNSRSCGKKIYMAHLNTHAILILK